jgi:putative membrane protein
MKFIIRLLITAALVYVLSLLLNPHVQIESFTTALIFALVLAFLNAIVKPILIILTLPITLVTLGIFLLVINVLIILLADKLVSGIHIQGFWWAFVFGLLLSILSSAFSKIEKKLE